MKVYVILCDIKTSDDYKIREFISVRFTLEEANSMLESFKEEFPTDKFYIKEYTKN